MGYLTAALNCCCFDLLFDMLTQRQPTRTGIAA